MILDVSYDLFNVISNLEKKTYSRGLEVLDLLAMANMPDAISTASSFDKEEDDNIIKGYVDVLKRNLAAFDLEIAVVIGDGRMWEARWPPSSSHLLMVSALVSGSSGPGSSPGRGHCVVFLGKTLHSHCASLHPGV